MKLYSTTLLIIASFLFGGSTSVPYEIGDFVADFKLKNIDGKMIALTDKKEVKGYILVFSCNTCPVVKQYEQRIMDLHEMFASKGYPVIAINPNDPARSPGDSFDAMIARAKDKGYKFPYVFDDTQQVARAFGATNTPQIYILNNEKGKFKLMYKGAIDNNQRSAAAATERYVETAMTSLLKGEEVKVPVTKAVGCMIKWSE
jgi:peroxiredoxin